MKKNISQKIKEISILLEKIVMKISNIFQISIMESFFHLREVLQEKYDIDLENHPYLEDIIDSNENFKFNLNQDCLRKNLVKMTDLEKSQKLNKSKPIYEDFLI